MISLMKATLTIITTLSASNYKGMNFVLGRFLMRLILSFYLPPDTVIDAEHHAFKQSLALFGELTEKEGRILFR